MTGFLAVYSIFNVDRHCGYLNNSFCFLQDAGLGYEFESPNCKSRGDDACGICICQVLTVILLNNFYVNFNCLFILILNNI